MKWPLSPVAILSISLFGPGAWNIAHAQTAVSLNFSGSGQGNVNGLALMGTGTLSPYGSANVTVSGGGGKGSFTVSFNFVFSDGSSISATSSPSTAPDTISGPATVTAGTGKFAGASGTLNFLMTAPFGTTSASVNFTLTGSGSITAMGAGGGTGSGAQTYYFSDLAFGGGFQTTLTYINYLTQSVTCTTTFYGDDGSLLAIPFSDATGSSRTDTLSPGASIHVQTNANLANAVMEGWAQASCTGPVQASLLYRLYQAGTAVGEASVNAETSPVTRFVTFAQTATGVAYANPSASSTATVTFTVFNAAGAQLGSKSISLNPLAHGSANLGPLLGLSSFTGSVQIASSIPIVSLSLNAEAFPVFSSLPPGDLPATTPTGSQSYYFSDLAFGGGFQTTLTYINYGSSAVTCTTHFFADSGSNLPIPFTQGSIVTRMDVLQPGASLHDQTTASLSAAVTEGWAQASCTGPVQASLLYRLYQSGTAIGEASVNAETTPTSVFATFAQTATGVAYANPNNQSAPISFIVFDSSGNQLASTAITVPALGHGSANLGPLLGLTSFSGFVEITSPFPIISLSLNAEAFPVFSSLPPGDLPGSTLLVP